MNSTYLVGAPTVGRFGELSKQPRFTGVRYGDGEVAPGLSRNRDRQRRIGSDGCHRDIAGHVRKAVVAQTRWLGIRLG